jgi:hypothetical protein
MSAELSAAMAKAVGDRHQESELLPAFIKETAPRKRLADNTPALDRLLNLTAFGSTDCWYFAGSRDAIGYGRIPALGENKAHRVSWRIFRGQIPQGMRVLHRCDVRNCVNPEHLFLGTQADNVRDMMEKKRHRVVPQFGESNPMARLTREEVGAIREMVAAGSLQIEACRRFNVSPMTVSRIVRGQAWK